MADFDDIGSGIKEAPGNVGSGLKKRIGPLPVWGWAVVTVTGLLIGWRLSKVTNRGSDVSAPQPLSGMPASVGGSSVPGGRAAGGGGTAAPEPPAPSDPYQPTYPIAPSLPAPVARLPQTPARVEPVAVAPPELVYDSTPGYSVPFVGGVMLDADEIKRADERGLPYGGWQPTPGY